MDRKKSQKGISASTKKRDWPVVPEARQGGALGLYRCCSSIKLACAVRQRGTFLPCIYIYIICAWPRCNATPSDTLRSKGRTSLSTLYTSYFTLYTSFHLISSHLIKAHLISSQMSSKFFSIPFISSEQCSSFKCLHTEALTHSTLLHTANFYTQKFLLSEFLHVDTLTPQRNFQTHNFLHTSFYTQQTFTNSTLLHTETFTQRFFYAQKLLRAMAPEIAVPKPDLVAEAKRRPKLRKICWQISHSSKIYDAQLQKHNGI